MLIDNSALQDAITQLGFPPIVDVSGRLSVVDLFAIRKSRTGIYLLAFDDSTFYIGQALDVCRRFIQHRMNVGRIKGFAFIPTLKRNLDQKEKQLIHLAEDLGLPITNRTHVSDILAETDLDQLVSVDAQQAWISTWPRLQPSASERVEFSQNSPAWIRTKHAWERLYTNSQWPIVQGCLRVYAKACIPFPKQTEYSFWSISCFPATNRNTWPRFTAINAGVMEILVLGWNKKNNGTWGFVNVSRKLLLQAYGSKDGLDRAWPNIECDDTRPYRSAGSDQIRLHASSIQDLTELFENEVVCNAAANLLLRVMRSRATIYSKYHCPGLAENIITDDADWILNNRSADTI